MVKLISLSYADSFVPVSPPSSPGRSFSQPILTSDLPTSTQETIPETIPEAMKDSMMSEWTREIAIAAAQETSKSTSLNGSRAGTNPNTRNFLAVNGNLNGTNSGTNSPHGHHHKAHSHKSMTNSAYGLVGGLGAIQKVRKGSTPPSESSRASVTRVDALKRILSGQQAILPAKERPHSDASSDSMVSYDFTASEVSFNPPTGGETSVPLVDRSASLRGPRPRSRSTSKSVEGMSTAVAEERARSLSSHPVVSYSDEPDEVPPVPPLPKGVGEVRKSRSVKRSGTKTRKNEATGVVASLWGEEEKAVDLESLLKGIEGAGKGKVVKPPY